MTCNRQLYLCTGPVGSAKICGRHVRPCTDWRQVNEHGTKTFVGILVAVAVVLVVSWIYWYGFTFELRFAVGALILAIPILAGDIFPLRISEKSTVGVWDIGLVVAVAMLGPTWAAISVLPSAFFVGKRDWIRTAYEIGHNTVIVYIAGIVFSSASTPLLAGTESPTSQVVYGTFATGLALLGANKAITALLFKIKHGQDYTETWEEIGQPYLLSDTVNVATAGLGVLALLVYGPIAAVVVIAGSIGSQVLVYRSRERVQENLELRSRVAALEEALTTSNTTFGTMIIRDLGRRDGYTHRHAAATAVYAADLAAELKLDDVRVGRLRMAGLLHNIGLFSLPEDLLLTTGKLNSIAWSKMSEHPVRSEQALAAVSEFKEMAGWVRWHHERIDGRGYPDKLRGPWIPLEAKILAVAQAYAAMVLDQPRRPGMTPAEARKRLTNGIDTEFDGVIVRAFLRILDTETEGYRMADDYRFLFPTPEGQPATPLALEQSLES